MNRSNNLRIDLGIEDIDNKGNI